MRIGEHKAIEERRMTVNSGTEKVRGGIDGDRNKKSVTPSDPYRTRVIYSSLTRIGLDLGVI